MVPRFVIRKIVASVLLLTFLLSNSAIYPNVQNNFVSERASFMKTEGIVRSPFRAELENFAAPFRSEARSIDDRNRKLRVERLEDRNLLNGGPIQTDNYTVDVSGNGLVSPLDALRVINQILINPNAVAETGDARDVDHNGRIDERDANTVINVLKNYSNLGIPLYHVTPNGIGFLSVGYGGYFGEDFLDVFDLKGEQPAWIGTGTGFWGPYTSSIVFGGSPAARYTYNPETRVLTGTDIGETHSSAIAEGIFYNQNSKQEIFPDSAELARLGHQYTKHPAPATVLHVFKVGNLQFVEGTQVDGVPFTGVGAYTFLNAQFISATVFPNFTTSVSPDTFQVTFAEIGKLNTYGFGEPLEGRFPGQRPFTLISSIVGSVVSTNPDFAYRIAPASFPGNSKLSLIDLRHSNHEILVSVGSDVRHAPGVIDVSHDVPVNGHTDNVVVASFDDAGPIIGISQINFYSLNTLNSGNQLPVVGMNAVAHNIQFGNGNVTFSATVRGPNDTVLEKTYTESLTDVLAGRQPTPVTNATAAVFGSDFNPLEENLVKPFVNLLNQKKVSRSEARDSETLDRARQELNRLQRRAVKLVYVLYPPSPNGEKRDKQAADELRSVRHQISEVEERIERLEALNGKPRAEARQKESDFSLNASDAVDASIQTAFAESKQAAISKMVKSNYQFVPKQASAEPVRYQGAFVIAPELGIEISGYAPRVVEMALLDNLFPIIFAKTKEEARELRSYINRFVNDAKIEKLQYAVVVLDDIPQQLSYVSALLAHYQIRAVQLHALESETYHNLLKGYFIDWANKNRSEVRVKSHRDPEAFLSFVGIALNKAWTDFSGHLRELISA